MQVKSKDLKKYNLSDDLAQDRIEQRIHVADMLGQDYDHDDEVNLNITEQKSKSTSTKGNFWG